MRGPQLRLRSQYTPLLGRRVRDLVVQARQHVAEALAAELSLRVRKRGRPGAGLARAQKLGTFVVALYLIAFLRGLKALSGNRLLNLRRRALDTEVRQETPALSLGGREQVLV